MKKPKFGEVKEPDTIYVWFQHDMDNSWFQVVFPNEKYNGSYDRPASIKKIAVKHKWKIKYNRTDRSGVFVI